MRTMRTMRAPHAAQVAVGALILALPSSALALTAGAPASTATGHTLLRAWPRRIQLNYGGEAVVDGAGPARARRVLLEYRPAGSHRWQRLASGRPARNGHFTLRAPVTGSGLLRAVEPAAAGAAPTTVAGWSLAPQPAISRPEVVAVSARFQIADGTIDALAGQSTTLSGHLLPAGGGRLVRLQGGTGAGRTTLGQARTGAAGRFVLRFTLPTAGDRALRVSFAGDRTNRPTSASAGQAIGFMASVASWYDDGGTTACGFHATYGVANRTLPCGTHVTLSYSGRTVTAIVDDRGPFVFGRQYDLNQNTAAALGMHGVATVLSSV